MKQKKVFLNLLPVLFLVVFSQITLAQPYPIGQPGEVGISADRLERLSGFLDQHIADGQLPGAVVAVFRKNTLVHEQAYGYSNIGDKRPMQKDHIFYIQSMTKPIITVAFMMLYEEGHFLLNDPVAQYLPQFKDKKVAVDPEAGAESELVPAKRAITIADLLSHTAGLSHGLGNTELDRDYGRALYYQPHVTIEDRVNAIADLPLIGHPGEQWYYSAAPDLLALLIEKFSGQTVPEFLQERIFDPLGMEDTGYNLTAAQQKRMATYHVVNREEQLVTAPRQTPTEGNTVFGGTHGLFSTASDYLRFCQMLLNGGKANGHQLLSPKTIELMTQNHVGDLYEVPGQGFGFGFGIVIDQADNNGLSSKGQYFWSGIYNTHFFIDPEEELIGILMAQMGPYSRFLGNKLRQLVYQAIVE